MTRNRRMWSALTAYSVYMQALPSHDSLSLDVRTKVETHLANIHITNLKPIQYPVQVVYGNCESTNIESRHHTIGEIWNEATERLVWVIPDDTPSRGCVIAWDENTHERLGVSMPIDLKSESLTKRTSSMSGYAGIDTSGPWFDGVSNIRKSNAVLTGVDTSVKEKRIAIVGGGMAGLMTTMLLDSVGMHNYEVIEASDRLGGRIRTEYYDKPDTYQYSELGAMRFPLEAHIEKLNRTLPFKDHQLVFDVVDKLNQINRNRPDVHLKWTPFIKSTQNSLVDRNGLRINRQIPTVEQLKALNISLSSDPEVAQAVAVILKMEDDPTFLEAVAENVFLAHKHFIDAGLDNWSEFAYLHNLLKFTLNVTDQASQTSLSHATSTTHSFWEAIYDNLATSGTSWRTIDQGLQRLPDAFLPSIAERSYFHRRIDRVSYNASTKKVALSWKEGKPARRQSELYDYALISAPFSIVRSWKLPTFSPTLTAAIQNLEYGTACKMTIQFQSRFWEHATSPQYGGCSSSDAYAIGEICFPSHGINSTGPAVILASYTFGDAAERLTSWSEERYMDHVMEYLEELFGDVVWAEYAGRHKSKCWLTDEFATAAWASPSVGQHELYLPSYFNTENNIIFIGEHTSYTHAWISSALESSVRGTTQLLLDLGLVDEAKMIVKEWMGRWMHV